MRYLTVAFYLFFSAFPVMGWAIDYRFNDTIQWRGVQEIRLDDGTLLRRPVFDRAVYTDLEPLPRLIMEKPVHTGDAAVTVTLENAVYAPVEAVAALILKDYAEEIRNAIPTARLVSVRKEPRMIIDLLPLRWNDSTKQPEKLMSFELVATVTDQPQRHGAVVDYAMQSVLSSGNWYKFRISESGMHKVTYNDLSSMGFNMSTPPANIALFGNGGGPLPEKNDDFVVDDLAQNPILMVDGGDGSFDQGDYFIFYGQGPIRWSWNAADEAFHHTPAWYDEYAYYFVTALNHQASRITTAPVPSGVPEPTVDQFYDYAYHELNQRNLGAIGRTWYGELYDLSNLTYEFTFNFPHIIKESNSGYFNGAFASKASASNAFKVYIDDVLMSNLYLEMTTSYYDYGKSGSTAFRFLPKQDNVVVSTTYVRSNTSSVGYLDYLELTVRRSLQMEGGQMTITNVFDPETTVAAYSMGQAGSSVQVWDVTTPYAPYRLTTNLNAGQMTFAVETHEVTRLMAFDGSELYSVDPMGAIENQNLHALRNIEYLMVTHPDFYAEAMRLKSYYDAHSDLTSAVVTTDQVYNEFSSGAQDISAIRNMAKMLYDASDPGAEIRYLLLFGDASYDYMGKLGMESSFVPCWESIPSLNIISSIATDDYMGYLDDGEGVYGSTTDRVDIGIGRFVVADAAEAAEAVDKTIHYSTPNDQVMGSWRNMITFVADDGDSKIHMSDAEKLSDFLLANYPVYNINKIYVDAYEQVSTPSGQKAPEVNRAINLQMDRGTMIFNYSGHGGEIGLGHEQIVTIADINSWSNFDNLTVFITATCEFTRYDDPSRVSAGEQVFLNPKGGGIALFTTTRATYASANLALNMDIYEDNMFEKTDGQYPTFGDIIRKSKSRGTENDRKFILVGDPACRMAYPHYNVETVSIHREGLSGEADTIRALDLVTIDGMVVDASGSRVNDFNGDAFITVYDKRSEIVTYGDESSPLTFYVRKNILFNGRASVSEGDFSTQFMIPKDIAYQFGSGRISYYCRDSVTDAHGWDENFIVGGYNPDAIMDTVGPEIGLFLFDTTFLPGGVVNQDPVLYARISDESGINTTGSGIGHDMVGMLDGNADLAYVLNDFYEADANRFNQGTVTYPMYSLEPGEHMLSLKVWDVYNNSSTAYLPFVVVSSAQVIVDHLMNYPNPFSDKTKFTFTHNQYGEEVDVSIRIYQMDGQRVATLETHMDASGYQIEPLVWDGTTDAGGKIGRGFYVYRVIVTNSQGQKGSDQSKLIYIK